VWITLASKFSDSNTMRHTHWTVSVELAVIGSRRTPYLVAKLWPDGSDNGREVYVMSCQETGNVREILAGCNLFDC
jgi:hypothetical protein